MNRDDAKQEVKRNWRRFYRLDRQGKGIICPLCGSGSGKHGSGITENKRNPGQLKCWACGFQGDIIDLTMQEYGADYLTALNMRAQEIGITIENTNVRTSNAPKKNSKQFNAENPVLEPKTSQNGNTEQISKQSFETETIDYTSYYNQCTDNLKKEPEAVSYLQERGISCKTATAYMIGYDPAADPAQCGYKTPRIILPTSKSHYVARSLDANGKHSKMNNKGGSPAIFNQAVLHDEHDVVFVVEGIFDALSVIEAGAPAIALNSTSNANKLIKVLDEHTTGSTLVLCLDNDSAGVYAEKTIIDGLHRLNIPCVKANISGDYNDPNEALVKDRDSFFENVSKIQMQYASHPDSVESYIDLFMQNDIAKFKAGHEKITGFKNLDEEITGLYSGLYVIAASSSIGKTTFSLQIADYLAESGNDVLFFSLEQSRLELVSKSLARITAQKNMKKAVTSLDIRRGLQNEQIAAAVTEYKQRVSNRLSIIEGNFNCNVSYIGDYVRRYIKQNGHTPVVFIDYLQILETDEDNKYKQGTKEKVDTIVTRLKRLSRELDLTIFVISSINRSNYMTTMGFEALKETGNIEFTADVIWGLQLQCLHEPIFNQAQKISEKRNLIRAAKAEIPRKIELICLKNRYGIANFSCGFRYYPQHDYFLEALNHDDYHKCYKPYGRNTVSRRGVTRI